MKIVAWEELGSRQGSGAPLAAAIGVFDGLHIGHRELIGRVLGREGLASAVVTFKENPKRLLSPSTFHGELSTLEQRLSLIGSMGVELCLLIDFSGDFSKLPGRHFLTELSDRGKLRYLAVGSDFRCGHRLDTDASGIREFCAERSIDVELLGAVQWSGHPVSSSRIRKAILEGRLGDAASMLGRHYEIDLRGALREEGGALRPIGGQACPPIGAYESVIVRAAGSGESRAVARLGSDGAWVLPGEAVTGPEDPALLSLRLVAMVSRG